jgi:hypothetical protein
MTDKKLNRLIEKAKKRGKLLLVEDVENQDLSKNIELFRKDTERFPVGIVRPEDVNITTQLKESVKKYAEGEDYNCFAVVRRVPVTRFTKNKNGRVYSKELWERIVSTGAAENTFCLADHPEDEGSVKNIVGVWKNFRIEGDQGYADLYLLEGGGNYGILFYNVLRVGGNNGISSVGYGELGPDKITVDVDSYELERIGDWVLEPSQGVYAKKENLNESVLAENANTNKVNQELEGNRTITMADNTEKQTRLLENFERNALKTRIKEAKNSTDAVEATKELKSVLAESASYPEIHEMASNELELLAEKFNKTVTTTSQEASSWKAKFEEAEKKATSLNSLLEALKAKHNKLAENYVILTENEVNMQTDLVALLEARKTDTQKMRKMVEEHKKVKGLTAKYAGKSTLNEAAHLKSKEQLLAERVVLMEDVAYLIGKQKESLKEKRDNMIYKKDQSRTLSERLVIFGDLKNLLTEKKALMVDLRSTLKENAALKKKLKECGPEMSEVVPEEDFVDETIPQINNDEPGLTGVVPEDFDSELGNPGIPAQNADLGMDLGASDDVFNANSMDSSLQDYLNTPVDTYDGNQIGESGIDVPSEEELLEEDFPAVGKLGNDEEFEAWASVPDAKLQKDPMLAHMAPYHKPQQFTESKAIRNFLQKEIEKNPRIRKIAESVLKSKTLQEASQKVISFRKLMEKDEKVVSVKERMTEADDSGWLGNRL